MTENKRGAGVLLHITSLPSRFGIGDMGPEATVFADFLRRTNQKYWQLLPLNPTEQGQGHSPYSSISSRAGNTLLISPELLVKDGLLNSTDLAEYDLPQEGKTDYAEVERVKAEIFEKAWANFQQGKGAELRKNYELFCQKEAYWLDDFAEYMLLKQQNESQPWFNWPDEYKLRDKQALQKLVGKNKDQIDKVKWLQFLFSKQWHELRSYCNGLGIKFFGDLPFYISYDSVDVWSHRDLFSLDKDGKMIGVAGVPPDAFSEDGQLWGMPVFLWDKLKETGYAWWIERFKKNMELFDLLRLDHFRAFADYWEVAATEKTAKKGTWKPGPRGELFKAVEKSLGKLAFIAEDLGEINDAVYDLRDEFEFPGMKILQFAFGEEMPESPYIPHNYGENFIAYTGTHDNNTIRGWHRQEGKDHHAQLNKYVGRQLSEDDVPEVMCRLAYASVAKIAILPMQDILGLDEIARMNTPASGENNWQWRLLPGQVTEEAEKQLVDWTWLYRRD
jgi:4-alpha-glucanotransferase